MNNPYQNISNNERVFRVITGLAVLTAISVGLFSAPIAIFTVSMIAVYQVLTAIIGIDPVYTVANSLSARLGRRSPHARLASAGA